MATNEHPRRWQPKGPDRIGAAVLAVAATLGGCATDYELTLMPRDSGKLDYGTAHDLGNGQASVSIAIGDKTYSGTWVAVVPEYSVDYAGAGYARGWWSSFYGGGVAVDRSYGDAVAKALLQAPDGTGMRCDFFGLTGGQGTGKCADDKGLVYDVQIRTRN